MATSNVPAMRGASWSVARDGDRTNLPEHASPTTVVRRRTGWLRFHALVLFLVLVGMVPIVGLAGQTLNDEGAARIQVQLLNDQHTWFMPASFIEADPDGSAFPVDRSTHTEHGFAPLLKHPLYPVVLAAAERVGGQWGMVLLGILGTVAASVAAALIARELRPGLDLWTFWITGLCSPLLFDSFILVAHSMGAAGAGFGALGVLRFLRRGRRGDLVLALVGIAWVTLLRNEGLLLGIALGAAVIAVTLANRRWSPGPASSRRWLGPAVAVVAAAAFAVDRLAVRLLAPTTLPTTLSPTATSGYVADRVDAFVLTWLLPGYASSPHPIVGPVLVVVFGAFLAFRLRRREPDLGMCIIALVGMWAGAVYWVSFTAVGIVPGILMAFPLLAVAIVGWRRPRPTTVPVVVLGTTVTLFAVAVLATTYGVGGTTEWGSRYLAIGIPLVTPLIALTLERLYRRLPARRWRLAAIAAVPLMVAPAVVSITSLRAAHQTSVQIADRVAEHIDDTTPGDGGKPVVVTDLLYLPRIAWRQVDRARWLAVEDDQLPDTFERLDRLGIDEFLFITDEEHPRVGRGFVVRHCDSGSSSSSWQVCRVGRGSGGPPATR